jgi:hypothetical protein
MFSNNYNNKNERSENEEQQDRPFFKPFIDSIPVKQRKSLINKTIEVAPNFDLLLPTPLPAHLSKLKFKN